MHRAAFIAALVFLTVIHPLFAGNIHSQCEVGIQSAKEASKAISELALKIYDKINKPQENLIFSPISIALGLALVESGTSGETRNEIQRHLAAPGSNQADSTKNFESLQKQVQLKTGEKATLQIANGFFYADELRVKPEFVNKTQVCFDTKISNAPFKTNKDEARRQINKWVADQTAQKIQELFKQPHILETTVAVLANAIYLKAPWSKRFEQITDLPFYKHGENQGQNTPFIIQKSHYNYAENDKVQLVDVPFDGILGLSFFVLLPKQRNGLKALETSLTVEQVRTLKTSAMPKEVLLKIPKFTTRSSIDLKEVLIKLGIEKVFSQQADFSRLADGRLKLDAAVHEAYIKVNENGTEAAAATGFAVGPGAAPPPPGGPINFVADHPFIFAIVHKPTGAIIFLGKLTEVKAE